MLTNKNIVITGSNRGIGFEILKLCVKYRANVWACMRDKSDFMEQYCQKLCDLYQSNIHLIYFDFTNEEQIKEAARDILSEKVPISGIVNNAGVTGEIKSFFMTSINQIRNTFDVNFFGPMMFTQILIKNMIRNKQGSIVNIASIAALDGEPAQFGYVTSKAAVIGATKKLSSELASFGIRVNAVAPGIVKTEMIDKMDIKLKEKTLDRMMLHRVAEPEEIANIVTFLLSDYSSFITGQIIRVDGGAI